ncbi:MAG: TolC family protein, partial [Pseudomonadota bacterium]
RAAAALELLVADYPAGQLVAEGSLALDLAPVPVGLPAELINRRADLQIAWLELLAADMDAAVAHRQRFPSLSINAAIDDEANEFQDVFNADPLSWSIVGNLTQPLFQGGQLRANEARAKARARELESRYLELLNTAFSEVENALSDGAALEERLAQALAERQDSDTALALSLEQYERGLVDYTTVLQTQQRAFDARASVVQVQGERARNRITLYEALGGSFALTDTLEMDL